MEYLADHGVYADLPYDEMLAAFRQHYPTLMEKSRLDVDGSFEDDAGAAP